MPSFLDIPAELLLDTLLPLIPISDLPRLALTCRLFAQLINDDIFWKRRLEGEYNFPGKTTARTTGWKTIYRGMHNPRIFVWGEKGQGRLGMTEYPKSLTGHVSSPAELHIPGVRIVSLAAGGMSFHALDSKGDIYVWGALDGSSYALTSDGFSSPAQRAPTPLRLGLPDAMRSISCGRLHAAALDTKNRVWNFVSWGRPFHFTSSLLCDVIQVECGWSFTSALTKSGDVFVWFPFTGVLEQHIRTRDEQMDQEGERLKARPNLEDRVIPCATWECNLDPTVLPPPPGLPALQDNVSEETKIVQIAAMDQYMVALTNQGHVLKFGVLHDESSASTGRWIYLPQFSDTQHLKHNPAYSDSEKLDPPSNMHITHISAHFHTFIAYSTGSASSVVLIGDESTRETTPAQIIPSLQNRGIIAVVLGDYHFGALTDAGEFLSWGQYSNGALGLGDPAELEIGAPGGYDTVQQRNLAREGRAVRPPDVTSPTRVKFVQTKKNGETKEKRVFCFAATASGWHTGALVIDLDPGLEEVEIEETSEEQVLHPPSRHFLPPYGPDTVLPPRGALSAFRIGHAGRGAGRGLSATGFPEVEQDNHNQQEAGDPPIVGRSSGVHFRGMTNRPRIGFPGRFMNRGGGPSTEL